MGKVDEKKNRIEEGLGIAGGLEVPLGLEQIQKNAIKNLGNTLKGKAKDFIKSNIKTGNEKLDNALSSVVDGANPVDVARAHVSGAINEAGANNIVDNIQNPAELVNQVVGDATQNLVTPEVRAVLGRPNETLRTARIPSYQGRNMTRELDGLTEQGRNQYLRIVDGDPLEMGSDIPTHIFDYAKAQRESLLRRGIANPLSREEQEIYGRAVGQANRVNTMGRDLVEPGNSSQRIGDLLRGQPPPQEQQQQPQEVEMQDLSGVEQPTDRTTEDDNENEGDETQEQLNTETPLETQAEAKAEDAVGGDVAKTVGASVGEDIGEDAAEDSVLGPIGLLAGLGTGIASLVEDLKKRTVAPAIPLYQSGA